MLSSAHREVSSCVTVLKVHVWWNSCHVRTEPDICSPQCLRFHYSPDECSKWNWNPNLVQYDHHCICLEERRGSGSSDPGRRNQVTLKSTDGSAQQRAEDGPQSLWLPPTGQDMPQAPGMPRIYFPSFPFLITTHGLHKHTSPWRLLLGLSPPPGQTTLSEM